MTEQPESTVRDVKTDPSVAGTEVTETRAQWNYKFAQTTILVCLWISMGYYDSLIGTTLPDLRDRLEAGSDQISTARAMKQLGSLAGGLLTGLMSDRFYGRNNLLLGIGMSMAGAVVIAHPWAHYVEVLGTLYFLEGIAQGGIDSVGNAFVMSLWGAKADPAVHSVHFGYTLGSIFTPLTTAPFLSPEKDLTNCTMDWNATEPTTICDDLGFSTTTSDGRFPEGSQIEIPYAIAGCVALLVALVLFGFHIKGVPEGTKFHSSPKSSWKQVLSPGSCAGGKSGLGAAMVILLVLFYVLVNGQGAGIATLGFTYATESSLKFTKQEAALWDFTNKVVAMCARLLTIASSHWIKSHYVVFIAVIGQTVAITLVTLVGVQMNHKILFWVFGCVSQLFSAPAWGAGYAFVDKYIILYAFVVALSAAGAGLSGFAFTSLAGYMFEYVAEASIYYISMGLCWLWLVVLIAMLFVGLRIGNRHVIEEEDVTEDFQIAQVVQINVVKMNQIVVVKKDPDNYPLGYDNECYVEKF